MATVYLKKTLSGFAPADEPSLELHRKYSLGETYRAEIVKPRSYQHHKLCMALLSLTYHNLPEKFELLWPTFDKFRYAIAEASGHVESYITIEGEIKQKPGSLSYDAIPDDVEFGRVMAGMMTVCAQILDMEQSELAAEVSQYADQTYGAHQTQKRSTRERVPDPA